MKTIKYVIKTRIENNIQFVLLSRSESAVGIERF